MLSLFSRRAPAVSLPSNPQEWGPSSVQRFLDTRNPRKSNDRAEVRARLDTLETVILSECRAPFTSAQMVLQSDIRTLPIQLRVYRELHEYMRIWLW